MTVQTKNELDGWREASGQEQKIIGEKLINQYKKGVSSKIFWGIVMIAVAVFLICGIILQAADGSFGVAAMIFFGVLALLALIAGISLCLRAKTAKSLVAEISGGAYCVLDCMCVQTDHRVDGNEVSLIRLRTFLGQECGDWFTAPRSLARSFDALAKRTGTQVPDFPLLLVRLNSGREYHVFQKIS